MEHADKNLLFKLLDDIVTCLTEGQIWHGRCANSCQIISIRGWARWHLAESKGDKKSLDKLNKIVTDKLIHTPYVDLKSIDKANNYEIQNIDDFKLHHKHWIDREDMLLGYLNDAIPASRGIDLQLYNLLCEIGTEVQNESLRVRMAYNRLNLGGYPGEDWSGHDIGVCSKWIHDYFDKEYDENKEIDFNIG